MPVSDKLAVQALAKIREQEAEINDLRKRLGMTENLGSAIQKSLQTPAVGNGRNRAVSDIVRPALFRGEKPIAKTADVKADKRRKLRAELQKARGLRVKDVE